MTIYLVLLGYTVMVPIIMNSIFKEPEKRHNFTALFSVLAIYLVLALKKYTVGIDIPGYKEQYMLSGSVSANDYNYVYFEKGYILLQKIFVKSGFSFQVFTMFIYAVICIGLYLFIKKYSKNATVSTFIFLCYQFFLFTVTGLRQALAMGVCMIAFVIIDLSKCNKKSTKIIRVVVAFLLVYLASQFHQSAFIAFIILIVFLLNKKISGLSYLPYIIFIIISGIIQPYAIEIINEVFESDQEAEIALGLNLILLIALVCVIIICYYIHPKNAKILKQQGMEIEEPNEFYQLSIRILLLGIAFHIMLSGCSLLRGTMYFTLFLIPAVPNAINRLDERERVIVNIFFTVFLMLLFYADVLKPATFNICPYKFFWQ